MVAVSTEFLVLDSMMSVEICMQIESHVWTADSTSESSDVFAFDMIPEFCLCAERFVTLSTDDTDAVIRVCLTDYCVEAADADRYKRGLLVF